MDIYTLSDLMTVIETIFTPKRHFIDKFFKLEHLSDKEEIHFDSVFRDQVSLAPFVMPLNAGKPQERAGYTAKSFKPAYVKPLNMIKPTDAVTRMAGEKFSGELTAMDRFERAVALALYEQKMQVEARWEWLGRFALKEGKVLIVGDDYPARLVDFGRAPEMVDLITDDDQKWSNADYELFSLLEEGSAEVAKKTGSRATEVYLAPDVWRHFKVNKSVKAEMDLTKRNDSTLTASPSATDPENPVEFKGTTGNFNIYVDHSTYRDVDGTEKPYLEPGEVMLVAPVGESGTSGVYGVRAFGTIMDKKAGLQAMPMFPKVWEQDNPSIDQAMTQSAPLMIPGRPNGVKVWKGVV
ncbi:MULTISPECIES: major capsid protein [unclassified Pseudovibrio]|uniref:major capsid protein n=1 Tax=unclassified Pseudovibrio TaxID=2627060 RepID=UPI0007B26C6E|nr:MULTISPECIES: major capsid protein [unclassified Pseudovibrio]KZK95054.1 Phage major capsid protein E [Pseudovibrio sp. W74]KZL08856.1 Phage major capsid protein E [Pseudovibrio sp. Ad14]